MKWIQKAHFDKLFGTLINELEEQFDNNVDADGYQPLAEGINSIEIMHEMNRLWQELENTIWDLDKDNDTTPDVIEYLTKQAKTKTKVMVMNLLKLMSWIDGQRNDGN